MSLVDSVAWAKATMLVAAATVPDSPERAEELSKLRTSIVEPRRVVNEIQGRGQTVPHQILITLRVCEMAIPSLEKGAVLRQQSAGVAP